MFKLPCGQTANNEIQIFNTKLKNIPELASGLEKGDLGYRYLNDKYDEINGCCIKFIFLVDEKDKLLQSAQKIINPLLHGLTFAGNFLKPPEIIGWFFILDNEPINYTDFRQIDSKSTLHINEYTFSETVKIAEKLSNFSHLRFDIAINRYNIGLSDFFSPRPFEGIVNLMIALEAVMAEKGDNLTYKISMRSAKFIGKDINERKKILLLFKAFYQIRSEIVHGENYDELIIAKKLKPYKTYLNIKDITISEAIKEFSGYVRQILLLILDKQIRSCEAFDELLLE
ncbi:HEPN domain-containing protein [Leptospira bouyouniensis]|uniref:HEPN domain-containing protein n=1 Tax=Leptospira bouyouniensis TaxID=2484911 RepID=UPI001090C4E7|nr:HEPN domain-containing protein [Leptospira bouyouniensis]TGM74769.1 hypothetical protein EHQ99_17495 [Leptospira bouyouniensis]